MATVYRQDRRVIAALGGMAAMRRYPVIAWDLKGRGRYASSVPAAWSVPDVDLPAGVTPIGRDAADTEAARRAEAGRKGRRAAMERQDDMAVRLGLLPGSRLAAAVLRGDIAEDEARPIATRIADRHGLTDYDDLLRAGMTRHESRELAKDQLH